MSWKGSTEKSYGAKEMKGDPYIQQKAEEGRFILATQMRVKVICTSRPDIHAVLPRSVFVFLHKHLRDRPSD
eukprot:5398139-Pleurochrysis_carterae.AAC.5